MICFQDTLVVPVLNLFCMYMLRPIVTRVSPAMYRLYLLFHVPVCVNSSNIKSRWEIFSIRNRIYPQSRQIIKFAKVFVNFYLRLTIITLQRLFLLWNKKIENWYNRSDPRVGKLEKSLFIAVQPFSGTSSR